MDDRLVRTRGDRMIGGLAAGIGRKLGVDPTWVRLIWVVLAFATSGAAVLVYFVLLFVVPEETDADGVAAAGGPTSEPAPLAAADPGASRPRGDGRSTALVVGLILVAVGAWFLVRQYLPSIDLRVYWPWISIGFGVLLILGSVRFGRRTDK